MKDFQRKARYDIGDFRAIMAILRGEDGCPWDREQTHKSIRSNLLEEAYEVIEAIDAENPAMLREELGDLLMQVLFHAQMEAEQGSFTFDDVCDEVCKKLIERHPHVFGSTEASTAEAVLQNWDAIKRRKKGQATQAAAMQALCKAHPALLRAEKVQGKAAKVGFAFAGADQAMDAAADRLAQLRQAEGADVAEQRLGDLLFAVVAVARAQGLDPELSLMKACDRFIGRFTEAEALALAQTGNPKELSPEQWKTLWQQAEAVTG